MEACGLSFSSCYDCISSGMSMVKLASNFSFCCTPNPATLAEPIVLTYSKLNECPPPMVSSYILLGSIGFEVLMGIILLILWLVTYGRCGNRRTPVPRVRYEAERVPLLLNAAEGPSGQPNYGFDQETELTATHASAAQALGSVPIPSVSDSREYSNDSTSDYYVYCETTQPKTFKPKRPTTLPIPTHSYEGENYNHFSIV